MEAAIHRGVSLEQGIEPTLCGAALQPDELTDLSGIIWWHIDPTTMAPTNPSQASPPSTLSPIETLQKVRNYGIDAEFSCGREAAKEWSTLEAVHTCECEIAAVVCDGQVEFVGEVVGSSPESSVRIVLRSGDLLIVPAGLRHRFHLFPHYSYVHVRFFAPKSAFLLLLRDASDSQNNRAVVKSPSAKQTIAGPCSSDNFLVQCTAAFQRTFDAALVGLCPGDYLIAVFLASVSPVDGVMWCPDCVQALPLIQDEIAELRRRSRVVLVECTAERFSAKYDRNYPYRSSDFLRLRFLPTIFVWKAAAPRDSPKVCQSNRSITGMRCVAAHIEEVPKGWLMDAL